MQGSLSDPDGYSNSDASVYYLKLCDWPGCDFAEAGFTPHLVLWPTRLAHTPRSAVAISYIWGEFDREERCLGHNNEVSKKPVYIRLGREWDVEQYAKALMKACQQPDGYIKFCWLDQLSLDASHYESMPHVSILASIPYKYKTYDVAVLLPGQPCLCLKEKLDAIESYRASAHPQDISVLAEKVFECCANNVNFLTYITRIWVRQEFLYARHLRIVWAAEGYSSCPSWLRDYRTTKVARSLDQQEMSRLSTVSQIWLQTFQRRLENQQRLSETRKSTDDIAIMANGQLASSASQAFMNFCDMIHLWNLRHSSPADTTSEPIWITAIKILNGQALAA